MSNQEAKPSANKVAWRDNIVDRVAQAMNIDTFNNNSKRNRNDTKLYQKEKEGFQVSSALNNAKEDNPQEASTPLEDHSTRTESISKPNFKNRIVTNRPTRMGWKQRKKGRQVRVAAVEGDERIVITPLLPSHQYETSIRRRAVRKRGEVFRKKVDSPPTHMGLFGTPSSANLRKKFEDIDNTSETYDADFGDVSLGMKLNM